MVTAMPSNLGLFSGFADALILTVRGVNLLLALEGQGFQFTALTHLRFSVE